MEPGLERIHIGPETRLPNKYTVTCYLFLCRANAGPRGGDRAAPVDDRLSKREMQGPGMTTYNH